MAQTRRSSSARSSRSTARKSTGGRSSSSRSKRSSTARASSSRSTRASSGAGSAKRKAAAKKAGKARGRQQTAQKRARKTASRTTRPAAKASSRSDVAGKAVADFREALARGIVRPANLVILSRERIEEVMGDAVDRGRVTADDARSLAQSLYRRGRKETNDVVKDLEQLVGRGRSRVESRTDTARKRGESAADRARKQVEDATSGVRSRAAKAADPAIAQVDRARRAAGVGPTFPIFGYDDLTAAQVQGRLTDLTPAELRKVRDYEKRNANRKSVLSSIGTKLG